MSNSALELEKVFVDSDEMAGKLYSLLGLPLFDDSARLRISDILCSLSLEHWHAVRLLLASGLLPAAFIVHRAQFDAIARSIWALYGATDDHLSRLDASELTTDSEQAAKNLPQTHEMMLVLAKKAPPEAYDALERFRANSSKALNSYVHAGIHPIQRHERGYPGGLAISALQNTNGLAVLTCMQAVTLAGAQRLQRAVLDVAGRYPHCMPPPL
jgi:hypothetical protein